jgi:hypothetical protein
VKLPTDTHTFDSVVGLRTGEVAMVNINESVKREVSGKQKPLRDLGNYGL